MKAFDIVAFDFDGVIAASMRNVWSCTEAVCSHFGLCGNGFSRFYTTFRQPWRKYYDDMGLASTVTNQAILDVYRGHELELPEAGSVEGIEDTLTAINAFGIPVVIVSTQTEQRIAQWLGRQGLHSHFQAIHGSAQDKSSVLQKLAASHGCLTGEVVLVDDLPSGAIDARKAGAIGVGFAAIPEMVPVLRDAGAHYIITQLAEFVELCRD